MHSRYVLLLLLIIFHVQVSNTDDATEVSLIVYAVCVTIIVLVLVLLVSGLLCKRLVNCLQFSVAENNYSSRVAYVQIFRFWGRCG